MTLDEVRELMHKLGAGPKDLLPNYEGVVKIFAEFAQIVSAQERESCAQICEKYVQALEPLNPTDPSAFFFQEGVKTNAKRCAARIRNK